MSGLRKRFPKTASDLRLKGWHERRLPIDGDGELPFNALGRGPQGHTCAKRIIYPDTMLRDAIIAKLLEIEGMLQDDRPNDDDRHALHVAQEALRNILVPETWRQASQTFYRIDNKPSEAVSLLLH